MCLIIEKRPEHTLEKKMLRDVWESNQDGWGIMYPEDGQVRTVHGLGFKSFWKRYRDLQDKDMYIHFRMATHGNINTDNCHPFKIIDGMWLMHNGVMNNMPKTNKAMSDTWHLVNEILNPLFAALPKQGRGVYLRSPGFRIMLEEILGYSNRVVIMDQDGGVTFNDSQWHTIKSMAMRVSNTYAFSVHDFDPDYFDYSAKSYNWTSYVGTKKGGTAKAEKKSQTATTQTETAAKTAKEVSKVASTVQVEQEESYYDPYNGYTYPPYDFSAVDTELEMLKLATYDEVEDYVINHPLNAAEMLYDLLGQCKY